MKLNRNQKFVAQVYQKVFKEKVTGTDEEIKEGIKRKVAQFFSPQYQQWSNNTHYVYDTFLCHVEEVNSRSDANFAISFLDGRSEGNLQTVTTRVIVTDSVTNEFLSGVISVWTFDNDLKMLSCREVLFSEMDSDDCGESQDPGNWDYDVMIS